jgi:surface protein
VSPLLIFQVFQSSGQLQKTVQIWLNGGKTSMEKQFGKIEDWKFSSAVTNMSNLFSNKSRPSSSTFNEKIGSWDVKNVTNMSNMFSGCINFKQDLSSWIVSNVTNMSNMFAGCTSFNQNLSSWVVSGVTNMSFMFTYCTNFNQDISDWDESNVT